MTLFTGQTWALARSERSIFLLLRLLAHENDDLRADLSACITWWHRAPSHSRSETYSYVEERRSQAMAV